MDYDITVKQGATFLLLMTIKDPALNPIDLTGLTFRGKIRATTSDPVVQANFTFVILTQSGATLGQVQASLTAVATAGIIVPKATSAHRKITTMIYDIESDNGAGEVVRWLQGAANISPEVTY